MKTLKRIVKKTPVIREILLFALRAKTAAAYLVRPLKELLFWLFQSKEFTNFTYDLSVLNKRYLISLIASILGKNFHEIAAYVAEIENDLALRAHIKNVTMTSDERFFADIDVHYGRRLGWYAIVRAIKPKIVVETGVDKGLGSCVLTSALIRNAQEGYPGHYYGTDINLSAGYLLSDIYCKHGEILYGDSIQSLERLNKTIDLFINDSDHSPGYEAKEYETIAEKLSANAVLISDNSHYTDKLLDFALNTNRRFVFFQEQPVKHWYPGAGIGVAFRT